MTRTRILGACFSLLAAATAEFKRLGGKGVPLIVHAGQRMRGFSERGFESLLARSGR